MTPEPITPAPRRRWRRLRLGRWLLVVLLAAFGYGAWREYEFRQAIKEVGALGWEWEYDDPFEAIQKDWKAAFRKATWTDGKRDLVVISAVAEFENHAHVIRRLDPKSLDLSICIGLTNVDALKGRSALQTLDLSNCTRLTNVDALKGLSALETLNLHGCTGLTNGDGLKGLSVLQTLDMSGCTGLTNVNALKGRSSLLNLHLAGCTGLINVDGLAGLPALGWLDLAGCTGLTNVDALKGLPALKELDLRGCTKLPAEAVAALSAALPSTNIFAPNP